MSETEYVESAAPEAVEAEAPEAPAEDAWSGVSQEDWEATQQALNVSQETLQQLQSLVQPPQTEQAPSLPEWLDEEDQAKLDAYFESKMAPYADYTQQAILQEAEAQAKDILTDIVAREGEFLIEGSLEKARTLANSYVPQMAQKYGYGPQAAEHALEQAAKDIREWEQAVGEAYHQRQINQLSNLGGARAEPGTAAAAGAQQFVIQGGGDEMDVVARYTRGTTL